MSAIVVLIVVRVSVVLCWISGRGCIYCDIWQCSVIIISMFLNSTSYIHRATVVMRRKWSAITRLPMNLKGTHGSNWYTVAVHTSLTHQNLTETSL
jgi:hypothetical protein